MFQGFKNRRIDVGGGHLINTMSAGEGPPVLLLHGYPQCLAMWATIAPLIVGAGFSVVAADLRGYGDSSKPKASADLANYSFRAMAQDQVAVMQALGFETFHVIGHDRGARTAHRMALDHRARVLSLALLDIVPTYEMFMQTNRRVSGAYWHWYFLSQPAPFPEHMIGLDPDFFFETCLVGWGKTAIDRFAPAELAEYRRCWRQADFIHGSCADYRAAATIDLEHDAADLDVKVECPTLVLWGADGLMGQLFDMKAVWGARLARMTAKATPGGHFFPDIDPQGTAATLLAFLRDAQV